MSEPSQPPRPNTSLTSTQAPGGRGGRKRRARESVSNGVTRVPLLPVSTESAFVVPPTHYHVPPPSATSNGTTPTTQYQSARQAVMTQSYAQINRQPPHQPNHLPTPTPGAHPTLSSKLRTPGSITILPHVEKLQRMLDVRGFIEQLERLIEQPIRIPSTLCMCLPGQPSQGQGHPHSSNQRNAPSSGGVGVGGEGRQAPGKAKRDLLSVDDIWESAEERRNDLASLYNVSNVGEERRWLLDMLMEESDADSGGEEHFTDEDIKELLKIHKKRRKLQKEFHNGKPLNSQYAYYSAGLLSEEDKYPEHRDAVRNALLPSNRG